MNRFTRKARAATGSRRAFRSACCSRAISKGLIAWRCGESLSLRKFLGYPLKKNTPDHSRLTRVRDRLGLEVHEQVFGYVLAVAEKHRLLVGRTALVDSTTLEANAAMKSIVRKDT
ncbi:MAG: transposase, partial [Planctomycetaceae bacterium]|nr:transposase [Planctomycetaceae bacterium]